MKLDKLARQIRRDISASPKKAAALGLMLLVALYFWGPMVWGWIKPSGGKPRTAAASGVILEDDPVDPVAKANKARLVFHWERVRKQIAADPRMTPASFQTSWQNPFRSIEPEVTQPDATAAQALAQAAGAAELDPIAAGLSLTSVAIGSQKRSATINNESYSEGEMVIPVAADGNTAHAVEFRLVKVELRFVELERNGKIYTLQLQRARLAQGDEITGQPRN